MADIIQQSKLTITIENEMGEDNPILTLLKSEYSLKFLSKAGAN